MQYLLRQKTIICLFLQPVYTVQDLITKGFNMKFFTLRIVCISQHNQV